VTALSAWLFAGETPGPREWAGGACIVLASALSSWMHRPKAMPPDPANQDTGDAAAADRDDKDDNKHDSAGEQSNDRKNRRRAMV